MTIDELRPMVMEIIAECYDGICPDIECECNQIMGAPPHLAKELKCDKNTSLMEQLARKIKKDKFGTV